MCKFNEAWIGTCKKENIDGKEYCAEHIDFKCAICGKQSTHTCSETNQLVCGEKLCDSIECKLEHFYKSHGYAFLSIKSMESELGATSKIVVSNLKYQKEGILESWYNEKYGTAFQVARVVYRADGSVNIFEANYRYMAKEISEIPSLFKGTFNEKFFKENGVFLTNEVLFLDKDYTEETLPVFEQVNLD